MLPAAAGLPGARPPAPTAEPQLPGGEGPGAAAANPH